VNEHPALERGHLVARAGERRVALALGGVVEVLRPLPVTSLAGAPAFVLGASVIRGAAVPVIDARSLLGAERTEVAARWISLRVGARRAALAVDEVVGARTLDRAALAEMPPLLRSAASGVAADVGALDGELLLVLQAARLVPESVWRALDAGERA
jgi:purine-binding chemotaxis protein CheW